MYSCLHDITTSTSELRSKVEIGLESRKTSTFSALAAKEKTREIHARLWINALYLKMQ